MAGRKTKRRNIVRFHRGIQLNIGIIVFLFVAFYFAYSIYSYVTAVHISRYEVEQGTIEVNTSYTGLILRSETVVNAGQSGNLDYFLRDNTKAAHGTLICSVDENGNVSQRLNEAVNTDAALTKENLGDIQSLIREYAKGYKDNDYYSTYNFKTDLSGRLMEALNLGALNTISDYTEFAKDNRTFHLYRAAEPGIVSYYTDGFENVTIDAVTEEMFDQAAYKKISMKTKGTIESGQPLYKLVTDEDWQIIVPIDHAMKNALADGEVVQIRFKEDRTTAWADYVIERKDGHDYLILSLHTAMIRYAYERFIDINIMLDQQTGLKIPNSSITTKTFEIIPDAYFTQGNGSSNETGLLVEHKQEDGTYTDAEFIPVTIYYKDEEKKVSYISQDNIQRGDQIVMTGSTERFEVKETARLRGVYNINKGYAVFKQIDELFSNNNYTIVRAGTQYGIMLYDHIALEGDAVTEGQMAVSR
ncbi:MAG: hypothetical protein HFH29_04920 [Eubacterium sp.]|nr:hypothetical protein [Eubacterium sp.]